MHALIRLSRLSGEVRRRSSRTHRNCANACRRARGGVARPLRGGRRVLVARAGARRGREARAARASVPGFCDDVVVRVSLSFTGLPIARGLEAENCQSSYDAAPIHLQRRRATFIRHATDCYAGDGRPSQSFAARPKGSTRCSLWARTTDGPAGWWIGYGRRGDRSRRESWRGGPTASGGRVVPAARRRSWSGSSERAWPEGPDGPRGASCSHWAATAGAPGDGAREAELVSGNAGGPRRVLRWPRGRRWR